MNPLRTPSLLSIAMALAWPVAGVRAEETGPVALTPELSSRVHSMPAAGAAGGHAPPETDGAAAWPRMAAEAQAWPRASISPLRLAVALNAVPGALAPEPQQQSAADAAPTATLAPAVEGAAQASTGPTDGGVDARASHLPTLPTRVPQATAIVAQNTPVPEPLQAAPPAPETSALQPRSARQEPAPRLQGRAWRLADEAYRAFSRGDYPLALDRADAALVLQPRDVRLHQLRVYALQKMDRREQALRAAQDALDQGITSPELVAAVANLSPPPVAPAADGATPQFRQGFPLAAQAYEQLAAGDYAQAAANAEKAFRIDPSQGPWAVAWLNALQDMGRFEDVVAAGEQAVALGAPNQDTLLAQVRLARHAIAVGHAQNSYAAMAKGQTSDAIAEAREAVRQAPDVGNHHLLLMGTLQNDGQTAQAERAADAALVADPDNLAVQVQRAYLRQLQNRSREAQQDIDAVLALDWVDDALLRNVRLIGADLALAANDGPRVQALLAQFPSTDAQAEERRRAAQGLAPAWGGREVLPVTAYAPIQLCHETPYGTVCEMAPWDSPEGDPATRAFAAYGQKRYGDAIALARQAVQAQPQERTYQNLLITALAAGTPEEQQEAMARLDAALAEHPADATLLRQRGYLRFGRGDAAGALEDFVAARSTGQAPASNQLDEAYALAATGRRVAAAAMLRQAIDAADAGELPMDAQQRWDTRSAIANFSREWGLLASVGYRGARAPTNGLVGQPISVPGNAMFSTVEAYWRPSEFLNSSTSTFDVYARLSNTLHTSGDVTRAQRVPDPCGGTLDVEETRSRSVTGFPTTSGAVGVRYTPWTERNLTFGLERQFPIGSATRSGSLNPQPDAVRCALNQKAAAVDYRNSASSGAWQAYVLYGFYEGTGLRLDVPSWFTMEGYAQAGYVRSDARTRYRLRTSDGSLLDQGDGKLTRGQAFAAAEMRVGRSYRVGSTDRVVVFPHATVAADWYSTRSRASGVPLGGYDRFALADSGHDWSLGAGLGVNVRYWFEGDRYTAQKSYIDWSVQYRARVAGVRDRAKGLFVSMTFSY